jgi:hypothetical protein
MIWLSLIVLIGLFSSSFFLSDTFAEEPIIIAESRSIQEIDGKWGFVSEWKEGGYKGLSFDGGGKFILRTAHDRSYIYVLVDNIGDTTANKREDRATVCLNSKHENPEQKDYCFIVTLSRKNTIVLEESIPYTIKPEFKRIFQTGFEGMGDVTAADRYSGIPHNTFEFKIPVDLVGNSSEYQFYVSVYDAHTNNILTWPKNIILKNNFEIPSSSSWGTMISPDKSLPEFHFIYLVFCVPVLMIILLGRRRYSKLVNFS